jgi:D-lactate dehydrogenase
MGAGQSACHGTRRRGYFAKKTAPGEAAAVGRRTFSAYASVNRTCEIGMTRATGTTYHHLLELVERATR